MATKIRIRSTVAGPYIDTDDLPAEGDIVDDMLNEKLSYDVPNAEFDDTVAKSLTLVEAIQEGFDQVMAAAALLEG